MAANFDPYYKWLGIPPEEQPPNHYRLLGIQDLEENSDVIEAAANRQMAYLQELSAGNEHIEEAQNLLGEVARARVCLLAAESKERYDAELISTFDSLPEADQEEASAPQPTESSESPAEAAAGLPDFGEAPKPAGPKRTGAHRKGGGPRRAPSQRGGRPKSGRSAASKSAARAKTDIQKQYLPLIAIGLGVFTVLIVALLMITGGGDESDKTAKKNAGDSGRSSSSVRGRNSASQNNARARSASEIPDWGEKEDARNKTKPSKPKPTATRPSPSPAKAKPQGNSVKPATPAEETTPDEAPEAELSGEEKARERLQNQYKLKEDAFEHTWHLANEQTSDLEMLKASGSSGTAGGAEFEAELKRRVDAKKQEIRNEWSDVSSKNPDNGGPLDQKYNYLITHLIISYDNGTAKVKDHTPAFKQIVNDIKQNLSEEFASREPATTNPAVVELVKDIRASYDELAADPEVTDLLKKADGTLADPPPLPASTGSASTQFTSTKPPTDDPTDDADPQGDPSDESSGGEPKKPAKPQPTLSFAKLKEQLTEQDKEAKKSLGGFNKKAKAYSKAKKTLSKEIKNLSRTLLQATKRLDSMQEGEQKIAFGKEIEKQLSNPLKQKQKKLASLPRPDGWPETKVLSESLKRLETTLQQATEKPEYSEEEHKRDAGSIDAIGKKIAGYRKAFDAQTARLAK